jgi:hypothetical protein
MLTYRLAVSAVSAGAYIGSLPAQGATDIFEITVANNTRYTLTTGDGIGGCPGDTVLTAYRVEANGALTQLAQADNGAFGVCSQIPRFLLEAAKKYEFKVEGKNGIPIQNYRFITQIVQ